MFNVIAKRKFKGKNNKKWLPTDGVINFHEHFLLELYEIC